LAIRIRIGDISGTAFHYGDFFSFLEVADTEHLRCSASAVAVMKPMPRILADHRFGPHDGESIQHVRGHTIQHRQYKPVDSPKCRSHQCLPLQHVELLLTKCHDLSLRRCPQPKQSEQCAPEQVKDILHRVAASSDSTSFASGPGFRQGHRFQLWIIGRKIVPHAFCNAGPATSRGLFWSFTGYSCAVYVDDLRRRSTHGLGNSCSRLIGAESYMAGRRRL